MPWVVTASTGILAARRPTLTALAAVAVLTTGCTATLRGDEEPPEIGTPTAVPAPPSAPPGGSLSATPPRDIAPTTPSPADVSAPTDTSTSSVPPRTSFRGLPWAGTWPAGVPGALARWNDTDDPFRRAPSAGSPTAEAPRTEPAPETLATRAETAPESPAAGAPPADPVPPAGVTDRTLSVPAPPPSPAPLETTRPQPPPTREAVIADGHCHPAT